MTSESEDAVWRLQCKEKSRNIGINNPKNHYQKLMTQSPMKTSNWIQQTDQAMIRAAARARAVAAASNTAIHIIKEGRIVEIRPLLNVHHLVPDKRHEEPGLSVLREDSLPYGNQKPCAESPYI